MTRIAILLSGRGSNFVALAEAIDRGELTAEIALVVSNTCNALGILEAKRRGLKTVEIPHRSEPSRASHETKVLRVLEAAEVEWVCLAGYMRKLSKEFVARYPLRILNIHPSLLPAFPGLQVHEQTLEHGVKISGCTVHFVNDGLDSGPIVMQRSVEVLDTDTPETLAARILEQEHLAYPRALAKLLTEPWSANGRRVEFASA